MLAEYLHNSRGPRSGKRDLLSTHTQVLYVNALPPGVGSTQKQGCTASVRKLQSGNGSPLYAYAHFSEIDREGAGSRESIWATLMPTNE
jgi:hypothetical protein